MQTTVGKYGVHRNGKQIFFGKWDFTEIPGTVPAALKADFEFSQMAIAEIDELKAKLTAEGKLTEMGIREEVRKSAHDALRYFQDKRTKKLPNLRKQIEDRERQMQGTLKREPTDLAGQLADQEKRTWLRGLKGEAKSGIILKMLGGERPDLAAAVLRGEMPELSGMTPDSFDVLKKEAVKLVNPELYQALEDDKRALQMATEAIETAQSTIMEASGYFPRVTDLDKPQPPADTAPGPIDFVAEAAALEKRMQGEAA